MRDQNLEINPDFVAVLKRIVKGILRGSSLSTNLYGNSLIIGAGTRIRKILAGSASVNPGSIAATSTGTATFTITGASLGDFLILNRPSGLNDDLIVSGHAISATDTATLYLYNPTAGAIDDGANTWTWLWIDTT